MPTGLAALDIGSSRNPNWFVAIVTSNSLVFLWIEASGRLAQPVSASKRWIVGGGPMPSRRNPTSATKSARRKLTTKHRATLTARIQLTIAVTESPSWRKWKRVSAIFFLASFETT